MITSFTAERVSVTNQMDNYLIQRHLFAYEFAARHISDNIMEIGCGEGYGYTLLNSRVRHYVGIDKQMVNTSSWNSGNTDFFQMKVPKLKNIPSNMFDFVISFQVIEHVKDDQLFISEAHRVLKKGGKLLLSTPNKLTSFTRNPFHVREYTAGELYSRVHTCFSSPQIMGVHPSAILKEYLVSHKMQVDKILKWDILKLEKRLPRMLLKIPYNLFNQLNKAMVFQKKPEKLNEIGQADFILGDPTAESLDFFVVAEK